jgi:hypothetical protein
VIRRREDNPDYWNLALLLRPRGERRCKRACAERYDKFATSIHLIPWFSAREKQG